MYHSVNVEGLKRVALVELNRSQPQNVEEAHMMLRGRLGAYEQSEKVIADGIRSYFARR